MVFNSTCGGTGSGLGSLIIERLSVDYPKKPKFGVNIFPSPYLSASVLDAYNFVLAINDMLEHLDVATAIDNEALYGIYDRYLESDLVNYKSINQLIA
jgi:tubulin alpha